MPKQDVPPNRQPRYFPRSLHNNSEVGGGAAEEELVDDTGTNRARGVYIKDIAEELGVHPRTLSRAIEGEGSPSVRRPASRGSKLDAYKPAVDRLLGQGVWNARVTFREIRAAGYQGGASILRGYIQPKRPLRAARATVRFETAPDQQLQNDWAEILIPDYFAIAAA